MDKKKSTSNINKSYLTNFSQSILYENDNFLIIDRRNNAIELSKDKIVSISNMRIVPFDQLITLEKDAKNKTCNLLVN